MTTSKIEWTDRSDWNPVRGCTRVSRGCGGPGDHGGCYAEAMAARFSLPAVEVEKRWRSDPKNAGKTPPAFRDQWGRGFAEMRDGRPRWTGRVEFLEDRLLDPLRWPRTPAKVFPNSTSDFFHEELPDEAIDKLFAVMALCPHLTFQIPTKRAERMRLYFSGIPEMPDLPDARSALIEGTAQSIYAALHPEEDSDAIGMQLAVHLPLPNVWLGVSVEDQEAADERIPHLLATPAAALHWPDICLLSGVPFGNGYFYAGRRWLIETKAVEAVGEAAQITALGMSMASTSAPVILSEVLQMWRARVPVHAGVMLDRIADRNGDWITTAALSKAASIKPGNGHWYHGISSIRDPGLIEQDGDRFRLSELLRNLPK